MLTLVLYLLVGTGFAAVRAIRGESPALAGYGDLNEVTGIWVERNILLRNTIWPRRSYLEIIDFPENLRIPRESIPPTLRVRAWKYVDRRPERPRGLAACSPGPACRIAPTWSAKCLACPATGSRGRPNSA